MSSTPQPTLDPNSIEREQVDQQIAILLESVRKLKVKRNTLSPISRLPAELLHRIFRIVHQNRYALRWHNHYSWICITHISQHWRSVAFGAKDLWGTIWFGADAPKRGNGIPPIDTLLQRSGSLPLDVKIYDLSGIKGFHEFTFLLLEQLSRIRTLQVTAKLQIFPADDISGRTLAYNGLRDALTKGADNLEELSLGSYYQKPHNLWAPITYPTPLYDAPSAQ